MNPTTPDDLLMNAIANGNEKAFRILFDRHSGKVMGYAMRMLGSNRARAEDVSQQTWIRLLRAAPNYRSESHFVSWLFTIVRNVTLNDLEKNREILEEDIEKTANQAAQSIPEFSQASVEDLILNQSDSVMATESVKEAVDRLPERQRLALTLWMTESLSYEELAHCLKTSVSSVKSILFRARQGVESHLKAKVRA